MWAKIKTKLKGWRTVIWNSVVGASAALLYIADELRSVDFSTVFTPRTVSMIMLGLAIAGIVLRGITTSRIGAK